MSEDAPPSADAGPSMPFIDVDRNLRLFGTAHISKDSADAVREQIRAWKPDLVAVELCQSRMDALTSGRRLDQEGLSKVIKEGKAPLVLFQSLLAAEQRKMGLEEGQEPGTDLLAAVEAAEEADIPMELVDRDVQVTLRRAWSKMGLRERYRVLKALVWEDEEEDEDAPTVDDLLKDSDLLTELLDELKQVAPGAGEVLVDERDEYIATRISQIRDRGKVLVVMGAGHLDGVATRLASTDGGDAGSIRLAELDDVPQKSAFRRSLKWAIPVLVMGLMGYLLMQGDWETLKETLLIWIVANAVLAAMGVLLARGHPFAVLTAAAASPITSVNPTLAAGWFAGYVQMKMDEPTAADLTAFMRLDEYSLFWKNRAGKVLLVTALGNLGSSLGAWIAGSALLFSTGF